MVLSVQLIVVAVAREPVLLHAQMIALVAVKEPVRLLVVQYVQTIALILVRVTVR